ncbi:uncharacterized protein LOC129611454 [Condylostylus longicornis]|uniref:uncharacterized protein LOC129611454 n=1 Tax=Condylostylus longicornis TaxID=2530218 RepID=UPI00244D9A04|nr:uncharacterized protein LOC129611454 [Condylostylus longicornis]
MIKSSESKTCNSSVTSVEVENTYLGQKCGEIYKDGLSVMFRCEFCLQIFKQLANFTAHIEEHIEASCYADTSGTNLNQCDVSSSQCDGISKNLKDECTSKVKFSVSSKIKFSDSEKYLHQKGWRIEKIFLTEREMENYIKKENTWSLKKKFYTKKGCKKYFRCNKVRSRGEACAMKLMTFKNNYINEYILYRSRSNHSCEKILKKNLQAIDRKIMSSLPNEIKNEIKNQFARGLKIKEIIENVEMGFGQNKSHQIRKYIKILQLEQEALLREDILANWLKLPVREQKNEEEPFIVNYEVNNNILRFFLSSQRLLKNILMVNHINLVGTKKITWHHYLVYIVGATITEKEEFLCFGIAVCKSDLVEDFEFIFRSLIKASKTYFQIDYSPTYLCRDCNESLETAFKNIFPTSKVKICWDHVNKSIKRKMEDLLPNQNKKENILSGISFIRKSKSEHDFETRANMFLDEWAIFVEFTTYFHNNWVTKNKNWYDGVDFNFISTNKPIDLILKEIEDDHSFRSKIPLENFKQKMFGLIIRFSNSIPENILENSGSIKLESADYTVSDVQNEITSIFASDTKNILHKTPELKKHKNTYKSHILPLKKFSSKSQNELKRKSSDRMWKEETTFRSLAEAEKAVEMEQTWGFTTKSKSKSGIKRYYRCNRVPSRGKNCESGLYLFLKADSEDVILVRSGLPHTCHEIPCRNRGLTVEIREEINRLIEFNWKTKQIYDYLNENNFSPMPSKVQVNNYIGVLRERKFNASSLNLCEIENWLKNNSKVPDCESKMFVVSYETNIEKFNFFISSKKLLQNAIEIETLNIDSTRKIEWLKFPVYILATTNNQNKCKCLGISVLSKDSLENFEYIFKAIKDSCYKFLNQHINPTILVTDSNANIQSAFRNVFGQFVKIKICWDTVKKSVKKSLEELNVEKETIFNIIRDLDLLHRSNTFEEFGENVKNFQEKWKSHVDFFIKFYNTWIKNNNSWYQGFIKSSCTSNTRLDSFVKSIRNDQMYRKKISLCDFGNILAKSIECWSFESESRYVC